MVYQKPKGPALSESQLRRNFYNKWRRSTDALMLKAPLEYHWLEQYPNNFKLVRDAFTIAWVTHKMTQE